MTSRATTFLGAAALALGCMAAAAPAQAGDAYINATVGGVFAPGVYGQIQIGNNPPPPLLYAQPVVITRGPAYVAEPLYLYVPPGHAKKWSKHCARYNACGRPVYFVRADQNNRWWERGDGRGPGPAHRGDDRGRGNKHDRHGDDHGRGKHGKGHDH
ncbi:MAG TPA: hypothetical protein VGE70_02965 [Burkholderiaceae bacterium]